MARNTKTLDPSADVRRDPAAEIAETRGLQEKKTDKHFRFNVYVPDPDIDTFRDFQTYCKHIGIPISEMIGQFMAETVEKNAAEIEEARARFAKARKHYIK